MTNSLRRVADRMYGPANKQMQLMLLAAEKAQKSVGKTSLFGADKWRPAHAAFEVRYAELRRGLVALSHVEPTLKNPATAVASMLGIYKLAYPNWPIAYAYCDMYIKAELEDRVVE